MMSPIKYPIQTKEDVDDFCDTMDMDDEKWLQRQVQQRDDDTVHQLVHRVGEILDGADKALDELEGNRLLGPAIVRGCQDLADAMGNLASELEQQSVEERRELAQACLQDVVVVSSSGRRSSSTFEQKKEQEQQETTPVAITTAQQQQQQQQQQHVSKEISEELSNMTEDDFMTAISGAGALLRDVESSLRAIDRDEADEIADVALTLARVFVISLQSFHSTLDPNDLLLRRRDDASATIEILDDDEHDDEQHDSNKESSSTDDTNKNKNNKKSDDNENNIKRDQRMDRLRVLWPPLGPAVGEALKWGGDEAMKQPLLAVALGFTLWPAAVLTAFVGAPLVLVDHVLQNAYESLQNAPLLENLERGAAQAFHAGRLSLLCGKLLGKNAIRVASKQVDRHGGIGTIANNVAGMALDRVFHPIETAGMAWGGILSGLGFVHDGIQHVVSSANHHHHHDATPQQVSYEQ